MGGCPFSGYDNTPHPHDRGKGSTIKQEVKSKMKVSKAIEIMEDLMTTEPQFDPDDRRDAVKLGIEALKRVEDMRISPCTTADEYLPGETEDQEVKNDN